MSKHKITFEKTKKTVSNVHTIGSLEIDFSEILIDGGILSLMGLAEWKYLVSDLGLALLGYTKDFKSELTQMSSVNAYRQHINWLTDFLDETMPDAEKETVRLTAITSELFDQFYDWCHIRKGFAATSRSKAYHAVRRLIEHQKNTKSALVADNFVAMQKSPKGFVQPKDPEVYEDSVIEIILSECRTEIDIILKRLKQGEEYLSRGTDPTNKLTRSIGAWGKIENILWFVKYKLNGRVLTRAQLIKEKKYQFINVLCRTKPAYRWRKEEIYGYLYPSRYDLLPFLMMISIKTGLNKESVASLKRDCIDEASKTDKTFKLRFSKLKTHTTLDTRIFSCVGRFSIYHIIQEVLRITKPLLSYSDKSDSDFLFIGTINSSTKGTVKSFTDGSYLTDMLNAKEDRGWLFSHGLGHISYDFDRVRETYATNRYKATGNLGKVQKDLRHKDIGTTELHYIDSKATQDIHEQTILNVQNNIVLSGIVRGNKDEKLIPNNIEENDCNTNRVQEQDVFLASCKDFYNRPGGKKNTPCDQPWSCFTCKNAVWTSSILPRVVAFYNFMEDQKHSLPSSDWESKFSAPYLIIKNQILPKFKTETVAWAEREALLVPLYLPNNIRMV